MTGATGLAVNFNSVIVFSEVVDVESGNIEIRKSLDDRLFESIDMTSGQVTGTGADTIRIDPCG